MATVTPEQMKKALSSLSALEGMASGYCELQDGFDTSKGIAENVRQVLAALASPPAEDDIRAAIQGWALYCFKRHGNDAHLYNGLAALGGVDVDGKGWQAQAPPASAPTPQDITNLAALIGNVLSVMGHSLNISESDRLARAIASQWRPASDPPGLREALEAVLASAHPHPEHNPAMIGAWARAREVLAACPLPASPQAETKRDCTCLGACRGDEGLSPRYRCVLAPPQAETTKGGR